ncbi:hypothetical protein [Nocardioides dongkuii]|uniref:hypothetical protein n=1 Tax=Nocardioides dongkuii TaxID=2760089 RepID=UPI0018787774|nr:hypothetical protein [Nocardioides dongkuii]
MSTTLDSAPSSVDMQPDAEWPQRYRARLRATLEELVGQSRPVPFAEVQTMAAGRVPLNDYDQSVTTNDAVRAWTNLGWLLTTSFQHAGWLHATADGGFRATREGAVALTEQPEPQALYEAANLAYREWDTLRKSTPAPDPVDLTTEIVHGVPASPTPGSR